MTKILLANGDSWAFGSELAGPHMLTAPGKGHGMTKNFKDGMFDFQAHNDYYRVPRIWPTILGKQIDAEVVNLSWPARSNDTIYDSTVGWILQYLLDGKNPADLIVVIGWSSLERRDVLLEDIDDRLYQYTFWPAMLDDKFYDNQTVKRYFEFYVQHLWTEREAIRRFVEQNFSLHMLLRGYGIRHHFFNSFYAPTNPKSTLSPMNDWQPVNLLELILGWKKIRVKGWIESVWNDLKDVDRAANQWRLLPEEVFLDKGNFKSFKAFIDELPSMKKFVGIHPSPESHEAWANHLYERVFK